MRRRTLSRLAALALAAPLAASSVLAQAAAAYPAKPIRIITPFAAGQGPDVLLRLVADKLQAAWGQPVVVENRPGAGGFIAFQAAKATAPDGHTLVNIDSFHIGTHPHLFKKLPYDAFKDFTPITPLVKNYFFIAVPADSKWKSVGELVAAAKAKPDAVRYGSWGVATPAHLGGALLENATGAQMLHIPYKEAPMLYQSVATGEVDWAIGSAVSTQAMTQAGKLRLLAVAGPKRLSGFESVPTVAEAGGPVNYEVGGWNGLFAPAGTPRDIVVKLNDGIQRAMSTPEIRDKLTQFSYERYTMTPAETAAVMEREVRQWGPVIRKANIALD
jgi:tripartite-type tricarboxylate transporter receptor subunit TctC